MFNLTHFQFGESFEDVINHLPKTENKITSQASRWFLHSSSSLWPWQISRSDSNDCNWTGQSFPTVLYLSPWIQSAASTRVCASVCVCVPARDSASLFAPLWQLADVLVTVSDSVGMWECVCGIMRSSQHALQRGSTVKPWRGSGAVVAEPGAVITAAHKQQCASWRGKRVQPHGILNMKEGCVYVCVCVFVCVCGRRGEKEIENNSQWREEARAQCGWCTLNGRVEFNWCVTGRLQ